MHGFDETLLAGPAGGSILGSGARKAQLRPQTRPTRPSGGVHLKQGVEAFWPRPAEGLRGTRNCRRGRRIGTQTGRGYRGHPQGARGPCLCKQSDSPQISVSFLEAQSHKTKQKEKTTWVPGVIRSPGRSPWNQGLATATGQAQEPQDALPHGIASPTSPGTREGLEHENLEEGVPKHRGAWVAVRLAQGRGPTSLGLRC